MTVMSQVISHVSPSTTKGICNWRGKNDTFKLLHQQHFSETCDGYLSFGKSVYFLNWNIIFEKGVLIFLMVTTFDMML